MSAVYPGHHNRSFSSQSGTRFLRPEIPDYTLTFGRRLKADLLNSNERHVASLWSFHNSAAVHIRYDLLTGVGDNIS